MLIMMVDVKTAYWGPPEGMAQPRPSFKIDSAKPGSDLAGETAAAFAAASVVMQKVNTTYAAQLLQHARTLFDFAWQYRGKYVDAIQNAISFYNSWSGYNDELVWSVCGGEVG